MICDLCKRPFEPSVKDQTRCVSCMIRPHKLRSDDTPLSIDLNPTEEDFMPTTFAEKICISCEKPFTPSSGHQTRCDECRAKKIELTAKATVEPASPDLLLKVSDLIDVVRKSDTRSLTLEIDGITIAMHRQGG